MSWFHRKEIFRLLDKNEPDGIQLEYDVYNGYLSAETKTFYSDTNAITNEQSIKLASLLKNTPLLETFDMLYIKFDSSHDDGFRRIVLACSNLKSLYLRYSTSRFAPESKVKPNLLTLQRFASYGN